MTNIKELIIPYLPQAMDYIDSYTIPEKDETGIFLETSYTLATLSENSTITLILDYIEATEEVVATFLTMTNDSPTQHYTLTFPMSTQSL